MSLVKWSLSHLVNRDVHKIGICRQQEKCLNYTKNAVLGLLWIVNFKVGVWHSTWIMNVNETSADVEYVPPETFKMGFLFIMVFILETWL